MKGIESACVPVLIVFGMCQGIVARKPKMTPAQEELVIQEGDELKIQCQSEGRLKFSKQTSIIDTNPSKSDILEDKSSGVYTFVINSTRKEDTGWYACAEEEVPIQNDEQNIDHESNDIAWIYVYVNSSSPFAMQADLHLLTAVAGCRLVVPCRPTSPNLTVKLVLNWGMTELPPGMTYLPKIGFILNEVGRELSGQIFECQVDGPELVTSSYSLHVADLLALDKPRINKNQIHHVIWGRDLILDCEIDVLNHNMVTMSWEVPKSVPEERWSYSRNPELVGKAPNDQSIWKTVLTVRNVEKTDEGEYICTAQHLSDTVESRAVVRIWDPSYTYINVTAESPTDVTLRAGESAAWMITIDSNPENVTLAWYKPDGREIVMRELEKHSKYLHTREGLHHFFEILHPVIGDNGNYILKLFTEHDQKNITLQLTVRAEPSVVIGKVLPFYSPGDSVTFTCRTMGSPLPNITWIIKEYSNFTSKENPEIKYPLKVTNKSEEKDLYHLDSTLEVKVNQTGYVICRSCNEIGCVESTENIFISDVPGYFGTIDPGLITEGDDINVTCGASIYNYTNKITWRPSDERGNQEFDTSRIHLISRATNFTSQSILEIRNVSKSDAGKYICEAVSVGGLPDRKEYELTVHGAIAPRFKNSSMENSEISIDLKTKGGGSMVKFCFAEGMPTPQVTWYKDDHLLEESSQYKFTENNCKLQIAYFLDGDSGRYVCKATNRVGTSEKYMDIIVTGMSHSHTLWIGINSVLVIITIIAVTYMGIRLHREKVLRKELLDAVSVSYQESSVRYWNVDDETDLVPNDTEPKYIRDQLTSAR